MKKLIILAIILIATQVYGGSIELSPYALFPTGENVSQGYGAELKVLPFSNGIYSYGSYDLNPVQYKGHDIGIVNLASLGVGYTKKWTKGNHGFKLFGDVGYYNPHNSDLERTETTSSQKLIGFKKQGCKKVPVYCTQTSIRTTKIDYSAGFGGKLGLGYAYQINKAVSVDLSAGYRYLELDREINGVGETQDFSGYLGMLSFNINF